MTIALACLIATPALADPTAADRVVRATELHAAERYADALVELEAAYALDPQPRLLYALGQLHGLLGECARATSYYEQFLASEPQPAAAALAREALAACRPAVPPPVVVAEVAAPAPLPAPLVDGPPEPPVRPRRDRLGLALLAGGAALGVAGAIVYGAARGQRSDAAMALTYADHLALVESAERRRTVATVLGVASGLVLAAGVTRLVLAPVPGGGVIAVGGEL